MNIISSNLYCGMPAFLMIISLIGKLLLIAAIIFAVVYSIKTYNVVREQRDRQNGNKFN